MNAEEINLLIKLAKTGHPGAIASPSKSGVGEAMEPPTTKVEMEAKIDLLSGEIDANEEENRVMQEEITSLYAKIDVLK